MVIILTLALSPLSANIDNSGNFSVQRCEAYANPAVVTGAAGFIESAATAAGLSSSEFVATIAGVTATGLGMNIASEQGVSMGYSFTHNINALLDAGDYAPYESLSQADQEAWGSSDNYNSAKLNSLMDAFDLGDARDRFYSSGGNITFEGDEITILEKLGRIGNNWLIRGSNAFEDIKSLITDDRAVYNYLGVSSTMAFDATGMQSWPNSVPRNISMAFASRVEYKLTYVNGNQWDRYYVSGNDVYVVSAYFQSNHQITTYFFSNSPFNAGYNVNSMVAANSSQYQGMTYYYKDFTESTYSVESSNVPYNVDIPASEYTTFRNTCIPLILGANPGTPYSPNVVDYPEDINADADIYLPNVVEPDTQWIQYVTQPEQPPEPIVRPENPYNPDNKTGTQEWRDETASNVMPLSNIRFDKLFPFCLMTDVNDLTVKVKETVTPGEQSDYLKLKIPIAYASDGSGGFEKEDLEIDGTPLRDLLVSVRTFNQVLLLFFMVFSLVMFWKSILTGD